MKTYHTIVGWMGRSMYPKWDSDCPSDSELDLPTIYKTKGKKNQYDEEDWPPVKVVIRMIRSGR